MKTRKKKRSKTSSQLFPAQQNPAQQAKKSQRLSMKFRSPGHHDGRTQRLRCVETAALNMLERHCFHRFASVFFGPCSILPTCRCLVVELLYNLICFFLLCCLFCCWVVCPSCCLFVVDATVCLVVGLAFSKLAITWLRRELLGHSLTSIFSAGHI